MTADQERREFERRICEEPFEDAHRLVFADWLDEHGEPDRAEFVRVQVALAGFGECPDSTCCATSQSPSHWCAYQRWHEKHPTAHILRRRELELFEANLCRGEHGQVVPNAAYRLPGDEGPDGAITLTFRRGFVGEVRCPLPLLLGGACGRCGGSGNGTNWVPGTGVVKDCPACHGTGRTPGVGKALFAAHPVVRVAATGKEPADSWAGDSGWFRHWPGRPEDPSDITPEVFDALDGATRLCPGDQDLGPSKHYPTPEAATEALSRAVVAVLRERAELPALQWPGG